MPSVKYLKYLGSVVQENGSSDFELKITSETRRIIRMMNPLL
jgi:hypothetical protein